MPSDTMNDGRRQATEMVPVMAPVDVLTPRPVGRPLTLKLWAELFAVRVNVEMAEPAVAASVLALEPLVGMVYARLIVAGVFVLILGGTLIWLVPNIGHWRYRLWLLAGRFPTIDNSPTDEYHIRFVTRHEGLELLHAAQLRDQCRARAFIEGTAGFAGGIGVQTGDRAGNERVVVSHLDSKFYAPRLNINALQPSPARLSANYS